MSGDPRSSFRLPDVGEGLEQAEIAEWLVVEGERVERDQPLVEILTDKSQTQLPSPRPGVIARIAFAVGDLAEVGQVLVEYADDGAAPADDPPRTDPGASSDTATPGDAATPTDSDDGDPTRAATTAPAPDPTGVVAAPTTRRPKAAPVVRKRALEAGIDLASVPGTGPGGRITIADLDAAMARPVATGSTGGAPPAATPPPPPPPLDGIGRIDPGTHPLRGIRRATAVAMTRSWRIPHIHGADEFDATNLLAGRRRIRELQPERAARLTPLAFFVMAVADGLRRFPLLNSTIAVTGGEGPDAGDLAGEFQVHEAVNVGIAVATERGLLVPVIADADRRSLFDLADEIARLSAAARDGSIATTDLIGGTCTVTNYGSLGGRIATPIIRSPEVAIVGFGSIRDRVIAVDGAPAVRPTLPIAVAVDHRLIDGDLMTAFQEHVIALLRDPVALLAR